MIVYAVDDKEVAMLMTSLLFIIGLGLLVVGAEALIKGATHLAATIGVSPLIIGLTIVALGTSAPELAIGVQAALMGEPDIVLGDVVGSNIFNILFVLGLTACIHPLPISRRLVQVDVPLMIGLSIILFLMALNGTIQRSDGLLLFGGILLYVAWSIRQSQHVGEGRMAEYAEAYQVGSSLIRQPWYRHVVLVVVGGILLALGSEWLVRGATALAYYLGVSELIIGLTVVSIGTSLPEIATSIVALIRNKRDIAIGNVIGSNIYNILMVLGAAGILAPAGIQVADHALRFDIPIMVLVAVACLPIFFMGTTIKRWEGALLLSYYFVYTVYLILYATQSAAIPYFHTLMVAFVFPFTILILVRSFVHEKQVVPRVR